MKQLDKDFLEWIKDESHFVKDLMRRHVSAYLAAGATEEEACRLAELDYLDYIKCPSNFLMKLGADAKALSAATTTKEYCKALGF